MGGGYNLNQRVGILTEYSFDHLFVPQPLVDNLFDPSYISGYSGVAGDVHVLSMTVDPEYRFYNAERLGAYLIAGRGFVGSVRYSPRLQ